MHCLSETRGNAFTRPYSKQRDSSLRLACAEVGRGHLEELYGIEVSPELISAVTDAVLEAVAEWQNRPLDC